MSKVDTKRGLVCSECGHETLEVVYTRKRDEKIVRLRRCPRCQTRHLTSERLIGTIAARETQKTKR
jgi:transcriptional regulator NrdR family protein